jgi:hypothetical protein
VPIFRLIKAIIIDIAEFLLVNFPVVNSPPSLLVLQNSKMSLHDIRPAKKRRRRKSDPTREGEVGAVNVVTVERVMVQGKKGPEERKRYVPFDVTATATTGTTTTSANNRSSNINVDTNTFDQNQDPGESYSGQDEAAAPGDSRKVCII